MMYMEYNHYALFLHNRLIDDGKLMDALALSDRYLRNGASDKLLQLVIESAEVSTSISDSSQGHRGLKLWSDTWQYCLRLKNKELAATLALKYAAVIVVFIIIDEYLQNFTTEVLSVFSAYSGCCSLHVYYQVLPYMGFGCCSRSSYYV